MPRSRLSVVGEPLLRSLTGAATSEPHAGDARRERSFPPSASAEVVPVRRVAGGVEPLASGYWPMQAIARADGWVMVPPESEGFAAGTQLEMRAFP
jgi:molybdopterin biosynthesis enzyme